MKCPYCGDDMELGSIESTSLACMLDWHPANCEKGFLGLESRKRDVSLSFFGGVKAYRCEKCRKIIIDESTLELLEE